MIEARIVGRFAGPWLSACALACLMAACGSSTMSPTTIGPNPTSTPTLSALVVACGSGTAVVQCSATARLSDSSTQTVTSQTTWQSSNTTIATVSGGVVTAVATGAVTITATYQAMTGQATASVTKAATQFTLSGTITDGTSGGVLPNIAVQITDGPNAGRSGQTDATGAYSIDGVAPGTMTLSAAAVSYETLTTQVSVSGNTRADLVLQRVPPSCSFTVSPSHLSFTHGGFQSGAGPGVVTLTASAPACAWTATVDPSWLFLHVAGSGLPYGYSVSGTGSATVLPGAQPYASDTPRPVVIRVRWAGGGMDILACQPNC